MFAVFSCTYENRGAFGRIREQISPNTRRSRFLNLYIFLIENPGYVVRWKYCVKRTGVKSLKGKASRIEDVGRDKIVYFFWQGQDSTVNEKGAAALMTVELDSDRGPQVSSLLQNCIEFKITQLL
jgi:hypothetical protein